MITSSGARALSRSIIPPPPPSAISGSALGGSSSPANEKLNVVIRYNTHSLLLLPWGYILLFTGNFFGGIRK